MTYKFATNVTYDRTHTRDKPVRLANVNLDNFRITYKLATNVTQKKKGCFTKFQCDHCIKIFTRKTR